jgi:hypothetical protein
MRALRFTLALAIAVIAGVAGASAVIGSPSTDPGDTAAAFRPDGSGAAIAATAADPAAGQSRGGAATPAWAVRVYRSETGLTCPEPGRTEDGDFGRIDGDGSFHPLALAGGGECTDLTAAPYGLATAHFAADDQRGARAIVFGVVGPDVTGVTVTVGDDARALDIANGAFIAGLTEDDAADGRVTFTLSGGRTEVHALRPADLPAQDEVRARRRWQRSPNRRWDSRAG